MSRIVIHIGTHKTATTHLQDTFFKNRALLSAHGVTFPVVGDTRGQHGLASRWIRMPPPYALADPQAAWDDLIAAHAGRPGTLFLSSEEFSRLAPRRVDMAELRKMLAGFDEVRLLCTLRNQASFLQSIYQQVSVERNPGAWGPYFKRALQARRADGLALDYNALYDHLLTGFAPEEIRFLSYDAAVKGEGGILGAFLRELDLPLTTADLEPFAERSSNVSEDALVTLAANMVAGGQPARPALVARMRQALHHGADGARPRSTLFNRAEVKEMAVTFNPLNARLSRRLKPWQPDFAVGPMLGGDLNLGFRGTLGEDFWVRACRNLRKA